MVGRDAPVFRGLWHNAGMTRPGPIPEALFRELFELRSTVDELIEEGLVKHWSVGEMLGALLPRVGAKLGVDGVFVETYGEDLAIRLFGWSAAGGEPAIPSKA